MLFELWIAGKALSLLKKQVMKYAYVLSGFDHLVQP